MTNCHCIENMFILTLEKTIIGIHLNMRIVFFLRHLKSVTIDEPKHEKNGDNMSDLSSFFM